MVPVNVRAKGTARELGNRISFMFVELPLAETPALEALRTVSEQTRARKASGEAHDLQVAMDAVAWLPSLARRALARMSARPESFHAVVSNVPGPDQPLFLLGRPLRAASPAVPLAEGHAVSIGVLSYHGRLHVGVYSDRTAIPDADDLARGVAAAFDALRLADADRPPPPWRRRARERRVAVRAAGGRLQDLEEIEQRPHLGPGRLGVAQGALGVDAVVVAPPHSRARDVPVGHQVGHDPVGGPLGDAHPLGDLSQRGVGRRATWSRTWAWFVEDPPGAGLRGRARLSRRHRWRPVAVPRCDRESAESRPRSPQE